MSDFEPFYDRLAKRPLSKVLLSFGLGFAFFVLQWLSLGSRIYRNSGWTLALLISCAALFQFYATATFRDALPEMKSRLNEENANSLPKYVNQVLSDGEFVKAGLLFGALNTLMGIFFGLPVDYRGYWPAATSYLGFFVAGFVCGIPVRGIYGVWCVLDAFAKDQSLKVSYAARDGRGGTAFIGAALVRFAAVTLTEGVLIAWYILHMQWSRSHNPYVNLVLLFWVAWPFILSTFVLVAPCIRLHQRLERAKREEDDRLQDKIRVIENQVENASSLQLETLLKSYEHYKERRIALERLRTWPYGYSSKIRYGSIFLINVLFAVANANDHWHSIAELRKAIQTNLHG